jgi:hypothetical protein
MRDTGILSPRARVELLGGILVDMHRPSVRELEVKRRLVEVVARAFDADVVSSDPIHPEAYATCLLHRFSIAEFDRMLEVGRIELLDGVVRECQSAVFRRHREQPLPAELLGNAMRRLAILMNSSDVVPPTATLRERAGRLLGAHPLRAGAALQLAAALVSSDDAPQGETFVCLDARLRDAARREGFAILPA